jgi:hypothetical protein
MAPSLLHSTLGTVELLVEALLLARADFYDAVPPYPLKLVSLEQTVSSWSP